MRWGEWCGMWEEKMEFWKRTVREIQIGEQEHQTDY